MAISFVNVATTNPPGTNASITPNLPTFIAGDLLIAYVSENKGGIVVTDTLGSWTVIDGPIAETAMTTKVYYLVSVTGSESAPTVSSDTTGQWCATVASYRGVDGTTPFIDHAGQVESGGSGTTSHSAPSITNTDANAWGVFAACFRQVATPTSWTPGSGLTERADLDIGIAGTTNMTVTHCDSNGTVATGAVTYSATSSSGSAQATMWAAFLKPAAGGSNVSQTPADSVGLTDAATRGYGRTPADSVGLTDTATRGYGRAPADSVGLTDTATRGYGRTSADSVGLTDSVTAQLGQPRPHLPGTAVLVSATLGTAARAADTSGTAELATDTTATVVLVNSDATATVATT